MANVGHATMQVTPSLQGMSGQMNKQLSILGYQSSSAGQKAGQSFGKQFTNLGARVIGAWAIGNVVNKTFDFLKESFIGVNSEIENSTAALAQMLGSNDKAQALVKSFQELASASATLDIKGASQLGRQLVAMGIPANQAVGMLKSLSNAAAGTGTGMDGAARAVRAFGQMSAKGRVQTEELLQLQELGIPAIRLLAEGFGKTTAEMQKMVTKGLVPSNKALPILQKGLDKFYGDSDKVDTFSEAWDKFNTDITSAIGTATLPLFKKLSATMQNLSNSGVVDKLGSGLSKGLSATTTVVGKLVKAFKVLGGDDGASGFGEIMDNIFGNTGKLVKPLTKLGSALIETFGHIGATAKNLWKIGKDLFTVFAPIVAGVLKVAFDGLTKALAPLSGVLETVTGWLSGLTGFLVAHKQTVQDLTLVLGAAFLAYKAVVIWTAAWNAGLGVARIIIAAYTAQQWLMNAAMTANPIGLVIAAIALLVVGFIILWKRSEGFRNFWIGAWNVIKGAALAVAHWFAGPFVSFFVGAWNKVTGFFSSAGSKIKTTFNNIKTWASDTVAKIVGFFTSMPKKIAGIGRQIGEDIMNAVKSLWNSTLGGRGIHIPVINKDITIPKLAKGGIATSPTLALIGEAGPEAVVPLKGANGRRAARGMGLSGGQGGALVENLTINVGEGANVREGLEEVNFQLRRISRGGVYA